jgi:hypothetical protein
MHGAVLAGMRLWMLGWAPFALVPLVVAGVRRRSLPATLSLATTTLAEDDRRDRRLRNQPSPLIRRQSGRRTPGSCVNS